MDHLLNNLGTIVLSLLTGYVLFRSRTPALLKDELEVTRTRCQRFETENKTLQEAMHTRDVTIADLKAKTDLAAVTQQIAALQRQTSQESQETRVTVVGMIQSVTKDVMEGFSRHNAEDKLFQQGIADSLSHVTTILDSLEQRIHSQSVAR